MKALLSRYRRLLAAFLAAVAAAAGLAAARPRADGVRVLVAARDLAAGTTLRRGDLAVRTLPRRAVPDGVVSRAAGRTLSGPVRRGEPLTDVRLRARRFLDTVPSGEPGGGDGAAPGNCSGGAGRPQAPGDTGTPQAPSDAGTPDGRRTLGGSGTLGGSETQGGSAIQGEPETGGPSGSSGCADAPGAAGGSSASGDAGDVATPVRLADAAVAGLLRPGDRVDVLAARSEGPPSARTIAAAVTVVAVPRPGPDTAEGALVVLRTSREQAAALARAAVDSRLTVTIVA